MQHTRETTGTKSYVPIQCQSSFLTYYSPLSTLVCDTKLVLHQVFQLNIGRYAQFSGTLCYHVGDPEFNAQEQFPPKIGLISFFVSYLTSVYVFQIYFLGERG